MTISNIKNIQEYEKQSIFTWSDGCLFVDKKLPILIPKCFNPRLS